MDDNELRNRIQKADVNHDFPSLSESVVAQAPLAKPARSRSFLAARWSLAGAAAAVLAVGIAIPQALAPKPLFEVASSGSSQATGLRGGNAETSDKAASDMSMIWPGWFEYNYIPEGLSSNGGSGEIYQVIRVGDPLALLEKVAAAFGVTGLEAKEDEWSTDEFPSYSIAGPDFNVNVWWSGPGGWSFSRWDTSWMDCTEPGVSPDSDSAGEAEDTKELSRPAPDCSTSASEPNPALIPSEAEMLAETLRIFSALEMSVDQTKANIWRDEWGGSVSIPLAVNGLSIPLEAYVGWDYQGRISYASGYSIAVESKGIFDTISPLEAVDRISDWRWFGGAASHYYEELYRSQPAVGYEDSVVASPSESEVAEGEAAADEPAIMPMPEEMPTEPEIVDVKINRSVTALLTLYDSSGNLWLVPGYLLYNDQGWFDAIVSVVEGVIALPDPVEVMPLIEEPMLDTEMEPRG